MSSWSKNEAEYFKEYLVNAINERVALLFDFISYTTTNDDEIDMQRVGQILTPLLRSERFFILVMGRW
jgi:hypothetical protein